jgi:hypothetical protein
MVLRAFCGFNSTKVITPTRKIKVLTAKFETRHAQHKHLPLCAILFSSRSVEKLSVLPNSSNPTNLQKLSAVCPILPWFLQGTYLSTLMPSMKQTRHGSVWIFIFSTRNGAFSTSILTNFVLKCFRDKSYKTIP